MIVIDPGHGGHAPIGSSSPFGLRGPRGTHEKDVTLALARRVASHLGRDVVLTRSGDVNLSLEERAELARRIGATQFVSIHAGSGRGRSAQAWVHGQSSDVSRSLAHAIHDELVSLGQPAGGVQEADMGVLRPAGLAYGTAACLVEVDDVACAEGESLLRDPRELDRMASAIARGIRRSASYGAVAEGMRVAPYNPSNAQEAVREITRWSQDLNAFLAGVPPRAHAFWPHAAIAKLYITKTDGRRGAATGFFVAPDRVVTNAHVTSGAASIMVSPAEANNAPSTRVTVRAGGSRIVTHRRWRRGASDRRKWDLGVVKLSPSQARTASVSTPIQMRVLDQSLRTGLSVIGYASRIRPRDAERWQLSAAINPRVQHASHGGGGPEPDLETLVYHIQALAGSSGAPVLFAHDDGNLYAVGVHSGGDGDPQHNVGTAFTQQKLNWIRSA